MVYANAGYLYDDDDDVNDDAVAVVVAVAFHVIELWMTVAMMMTMMT